MPEHETVERAREDARQGKAPTTQAGEFIREEIEHLREGKHGARSTKQAIAIGLSKARRAGVKLPPPSPGKASAETRKKAIDYQKDQSSSSRRPSLKRSRAISKVLRGESRQVASHTALSRQARASARKRTKAERSSAARKAVRTNGSVGLRRAARKAARTRQVRLHARAALG